MINTSTFLKPIVLLAIALSCMGGCVDEDQAQRLANQARQEGLASCEAECRIRVENAKTWAYDKGHVEATKKAKVHLANVIQQANDSLRIATTIAFENGRKDALKKVSIATFHATIPTVIGIGCAALIVFLFVMIIERMVLPKIADNIEKYIQECRWSARSCFGQKQRIMVEQKRWDKREEDVIQKNNDFDTRTEDSRTHIKFYEEKMAQKTTKHHNRSAQRYISDNQKRIEHYLDAKRQGTEALDSISKIKTGLQINLYRVENDHPLDVNELYAQCERVKCQVNDFLRWDYDQFDPDTAYESCEPIETYTDEDVMEDYIDLKN